MLLAFDVGNTNIVMGLYKGKDLQGSWRMETNQKKSADEYAVFIRQLFEVHDFTFDQVDDVIISTVVPSMTYTLQHMSRYYFKCEPIIVGPGVKTGLIVKYDNPKMLGADRIVNSVAALAKYQAPLIIIDFGTATTFCAVSDKSEYLGGAIAPGLKISSEALFEKTAKLPRVEIEAPKKAIAHNTTEGMQAGLVFGHIGMTEYIVRKMKDEIHAMTGDDRPITVIGTGGMAYIIKDNSDCIDIIDKMLTLEGLQLIYEKNKPENA